jgi:dGTPase
MIHSRENQESREKKYLASFASHVEETRGRLYPEPSHPYRSEFQRDRDRVVYSSCFRRLEYKTQVFINGTADHYRTRLTHTLEMTLVGRTIARALRLNEDLTETIALAHDIGHSPFGHVGERELDSLMKEHGGFDHNEQSLRWVEMLEPKYPGFSGLNLSWEVRAGLRKHSAARLGADLDGYPIGPLQAGEAQIADVADDIAYYAHDVEDGLEAGLLSPALPKEVDLCNLARSQVQKDFGVLTEEQDVRMTLRRLLDLQIQDVIDYSLEQLDRLAPKSTADIMNAKERCITFSPWLREMLGPHREFLFKHVYWHSDVEEQNQQAVDLMKKLFLFYVENPKKMGRKAQARLEEEGLWRTACDYISGMTDRYAMEEVERHKLS